MKILSKKNKNKYELYNNKVRIYNDIISSLFDIVGPNHVLTIAVKVNCEINK